MKKTPIRLLTLFLFGLAPVYGHPSTAAAALDDAALAALVKKIYIYAFPLYESYRVRYTSVFDTHNPVRADLNRFGHNRDLKDHTSRLITTPNNDTVNSYAWLDLGPEPVILSLPDTAGRYYTIPFMDPFTNNFAYIGRRTTGTGPGNYVIVGPGWTGKTPEGLPVISSPTRWVFLLPRILVKDKADLVEVHKIQDQMQLIPLSVWNKTGEGKVKTDLKNPPPKPDPKDPWNFFKIINLVLTENPPPADEGHLMAEFAQIGVGPQQTFDPSRFSENQQKIIVTAWQEAAKALPAAMGRYAGQRIEGWLYASPNLGKYGKDYLLRALVALSGYAALDPAEAYYFTGLTDKTGQPFHGKNRYRLHFKAGGLPPVDAFWSLTMYEVMPDQRQYFTDNPLRRYSIGDRTAGLKYNADGSLDIYIQHESPGKDLESNWLPAPAGPFRLSFRAYQPREAILKGKYRLPGVEKIE